LKTLRNKKKDKKEEELREFVRKCLKAIDDNREEIASAIEKERWKFREMSTPKFPDDYRKMTI
jgi:hypothetical protein